MDAPLETLLKLNNVKYKLPLENFFLTLGYFMFERGFKRGGAGLGKNQKGGLNHYI